MYLDDYEKEMKRTAGKMELTPKNLTMGGLGISGEAGEVTDYIKKVVFHNKEMDKTIIAEELGDVLWYLTYLSTLLGYSLEDIAQRNIDKLKERYPGGWEPDRKVNRKM